MSALFDHRKDIFMIFFSKKLFACVSPYLLVAMTGAALPSLGFCDTTPLLQSEDERDQVKSLLESVKSLPFYERVYTLSKSFLGKPYGFGGPLGEGPTGDFSKKPLWRLDQMDCTTYVETVMALSLARDFEDFCQKMNQIRYKNAVISYVARNHFTDIDWAPNNKAYLKDITKTLKEDAPVLSYTVDKKKWYEKTAPLQKDLTPEEQNAFAHQADQLAPVPVNIPYIKKEDMVQVLEENKAKMTRPLIFNLVGDPAFMEKAIGTPYGIYHQGFIFWTPDEGCVIFHATSLEPKAVVKLPLKEYPTFSSFFTRKITRPLPIELPNTVSSPCDGKILVLE